MSLIAEVIIPQMFSVYAEDMGYLENGLHHYQYFCEECDQVFASAWGKIQGIMNYSERGSHFYCPHCHTYHKDNVVYIKRNEETPNKVRLAVKLYKNVVTFEVFSKTVIYPDYLKLLEGRCHETFRFDIAKQTVSFSVHKPGVQDETIELGNPYKIDVLNKSILRFFRPNSLANSEQKSELNRILRVFRETVHHKLEKHLGHKVSSMFVSPGQHHGTFLLQLLNMAYRVACPDAPNLPTIYREQRENINRHWGAKMLKDYNHDLMDDVISLTRRKKDFVSAMTATHALPDKPLIRRAINEDPFGINMLVKAFIICQNYDYSIQLCQGLSKLASKNVSNIYLSPAIQVEEYKDLFQFLKKIKPLYGEPGIIRLVNEAKELQLQDCIRLYKQLNTENKKALKTEKVRLRDLHDWMSLRHKKQTHVNLKFDVPDHIVKRLSMQTNRLSFFLPKESMELLEAGHNLHNCVASYGAAMKVNQKWIVLVADDKGKLAACLEIKDKELLQAKLDRNKPVLSNIELNNEIIAWAKEANIKINTTDIKLPSEKKNRIRITA